MACKGCEERGRERAIGYLTGSERREYLQALQLGRGSISSKYLVLAHRRMKADIVVCHRCAELIGSETGLDEARYHKFRNIVLCGNCVDDIKSSHGAFCASCLKLIRELIQENLQATQAKRKTRYVALPGGIYGGRFMICGSCCYPEAPRLSEQIPDFLGGKKFVPELLRPSKTKGGLGLDMPNDDDEEEST